MVSGPINCVKYLVFIFNLIFFLFGITLIAVGAYVQYQLTDFMNFFDSNINGPAILLIIVGLVIFVVAFFGCCGAVKENYCMVLTFSILMMIILICQIGGAIAGFVYSNKIQNEAETELLDSMQNYEEKEGVQHSWDKMQRQVPCCGINGPEDWDILKPEDFPKSCCNTTETCTKLTANPKGCIDGIIGLFEKNVYYIGAVGIALAIIQVTGIVLSCCLARAVKKEYEVA